MRYYVLTIAQRRAAVAARNTIARMAGADCAGAYNDAVTRFAPEDTGIPHGPLPQGRSWCYCGCQRAS